MNHNDLRGLVDRAAFLHERLGERWQPTPHPFDEAIALRRLERWCQLAAGGDWDRFAHRLAWDGLDVARARLLVGTGHFVADAPLPDWVDFLAGVFEVSPDPAEITRPFVDAAQDRLAQRVGPKLAWLMPEAHLTIINHLAERLRSLADPTLIDGSGQGLVTHALRYPVLARQLAQRCLHWIAEVADFLARLGEDWSALTQYVPLPSSPTPGIVNGLRPGLSDPHRGGRTVWRVDLPGGSVAYKPKHLQMDQGWAELVMWAAQQGLDSSPGCLWIILRPEYGWMEWAHPEPWTDAPRLAQRAGAMLALLHLLHAADCHAENLGRRGEFPLLLDGEMLVYPHVAGRAADDPLDVMRTGLLPRWLADQRDVAEIRGLPGELSPTQVIEGYRSACQFLVDAWPQLGESGLLSRLRRGRVRVAPRPTAAYLRLLDHLRHPALLADAIDFSIETDRLAYTYLTRPDQERFWPLLASEHEAVAQGDVPLFYGEIDHPDGELRIANCEGSDHPDLGYDGRTVTDVLRWPPFTLPSPTAQAEGAALIHASLDRSPYAPRADRSFLAAARHLGDLLAQGAIERGSGRLSGSNGFGAKIRPNLLHPLNPRSIPFLTWVAPQFRSGAGLWQHGLIGEDLYAGRAGIALFLGALAHVTGEGRWQDLALAALAGDDVATADGGGRIYALSLAADLLRESALIERGTSLARQHFSKRDSWGVLDGEAGLALALLRLHAQTAEAWLLAQAVERGRAICDAAPIWTHPQQGLGGFSHGAAGIAYALVQLYRASGDDHILAGAERAWEFQHSLYEDPPGNWQDWRGRTPVFLRNWCNGAAGIGLAGAACAADLPQLRDLVERAAALLLEETRPDLDTLCCGHFGQIESLLEMGLLWDRRHWIEAASAQARQSLIHAAEAGDFRLYDDLPPHLFNPGFFRGIAGIGYTLLRLAVVNGEADGELPCVVRSA
jgi:lantibiotic modifying enzyme